MRDLLDRGGVILTANARAARALHRRYADEQQAHGATVWRTPHILDLHSWLMEQWQALLLTGGEARLLLNDVQEKALWQRVIAPRLSRLSLIAPARMGALAQQAYDLLAAYRALPRLNDAMWSSDPLAESELFRQWGRGFGEECNRHRWLPQSRLIGAIADAFEKGAIAAPSHIGWLGFDRTTPAQVNLVNALNTLECVQETLSWDLPVSTPALYTAASEQDEVAACAQWVRTHLEAAPKARIGILMPDLAAARPMLERAFFRTLSPQNFPITAGAAPALPFEFALGLPSAQVPLVHAALLLLRWLERPLSQQEITWLLLSSTMGAAQDVASREALAQWDAHLRNQSSAPPEMSLDALLRQADARSPAILALRDSLLAMLQTYRRSTRTASAGEWVRRIDAWLRLARWGEVAHASSLLYQAREVWASLLESIASLDFQSQPLTFADLLTALEHSAQETIFAPESEDAPVQVMGAYAAAGQHFDAVWFLGVSDTAWPAAGRMHPLLPIELQRALAMPHATPAGDTEQARRVTARVIQDAGEVVFSYAMQAGDATQRASSFVADFPSLAIELANILSPVVALETVADDAWVSLTHTRTAPGGQAALKRQADCPFQAFAFQRLRVRELPIAGRGLSAMERGTLLHQVLQGVWSRDVAGHSHIADSTELQAAFASGHLRPLVEAHAAAALRSLTADRSEPWQRAYLAAEERRLVELVLEWLAYERTRQAFTVQSVEKQIPILVGELALNVRADRIDGVAYGQILIDYKTGMVTPSSWDGARPEQPQLPLYAAFGEVPKLIGALFAQVRRGDLCFKGRIEEARANLFGAIDEKNALMKDPYTANLLDEWRTTLIALAESFLRGEAQVDPREYPKTCQHCPLPGLCRIAESAIAGARETIEDAGDDA